jgi:hypothetical protein
MSVGNNGHLLLLELVKLLSQDAQRLLRLLQVELARMTRNQVLSRMDLSFILMLRLLLIGH